MKNYIFLVALIPSIVFAHEPYVAPLAFVTENTQIPVISGYAEVPFASEYALKDVIFHITQPDQSQTTVTPNTQLKSATVFDLALKLDGTYYISSKVSYLLQYALYNKEWKIFYDTTEGQEKSLAERDYVISGDFKKTPQLKNVTREWSIETYLSKNKLTEVKEKIDFPLQVKFSSHPNNIKAGHPVSLVVSKNNKLLTKAEIVIREKGQSEQNTKTVLTDLKGRANLTFPAAGQYLLEITETQNPKAEPVNQYYKIISLSVN
ncbi:DUF4198 domain-containing protein [Acinetobacter radioresistens]|uniref:DUF4198 domain-containing protein n=1 Tax=Acinetobacter radioresistens TaxID=40216 RepID=UPI00094627E3|nr:DUF4198 domain-containing protein [Acinetobacter radioresistens]